MTNKFLQANEFIKDYTRELIRLLNENDYKCYLWYQAEWGSCYIKSEIDWVPIIHVGKGVKNKEKEYLINVRKDISRLTKEWDSALNIWYIHIPFNSNRTVIEVLKAGERTYKRLVNQNKKQCQTTSIRKLLNS